MNHHTTILRYMREAVLLTVWFILASVTLLTLPDPTTQNPSIDAWNIGTNFWGVSLYSNTIHATFQFSPVNDYITTDTNTVQPLMESKQLTKEDTSWMKNTYATMESIKKFFIPKNSIEKSFLDGKITYEITKGTWIPHQVRDDPAFGRGRQNEILHSVQDDTISITRSLDESLIRAATSSAIVMTYSRDDIIFDDNHIYITDAPDTQIEIIKKMYAIPLIKTAEATPSARTIPVSIINPNVAGAFTIVPSNTQKIRIDKEKKWIIIEDTEVQKEMKIEIKMEK